MPEHHAGDEGGGPDPRVEARVEQVRLAAADGAGLAGELDRIVESAGEPSPEEESKVEEGTVRVAKIEDAQKDGGQDVVHPQLGLQGPVVCYHVGNVESDLDDRR